MYSVQPLLKCLLTGSKKPNFDFPLLRMAATDEPELLNGQKIGLFGQLAGVACGSCRCAWPKISEESASWREPAGAKGSKRDPV